MLNYFELGRVCLKRNGGPILALFKCHGFSSILTLATSDIADAIGCRDECYAASRTAMSKFIVIADLIGSSPNFRAVLDLVSIVAPVNCSVVIRGETGTGKEVIARAIHDAGPRSRNPFVGLNCSAIPRDLVESELFGHERGAYTGAINQTAGYFQAADRGTLFLDEIGDLPLQLQPKLLRVLQQQQFERLGGRQTLQVNVRIIAATNQDLWSMVQEREFRADLYYRLNVFPIVLPPLRERILDIPLLAWHFVEQFARRQGKSIKSIPDEAMEMLKRYDWPGNIRELQNLMERAVIGTSGSELRLPDDEFGRVEFDTPSKWRTLAEVERQHILDTLRQVGWVVGGPSGAAVRLGLPRTTLLHRMHRLGIARGAAQADRLPKAHPRAAAKATASVSF
jgi:transcriptional regulator with GAF, ATPase, and Fis domain